MRLLPIRTADMAQPERQKAMASQAKRSTQKEQVGVPVRTTLMIDNIQVEGMSPVSRPINGAGTFAYEILELYLVAWVRIITMLHRNPTPDSEAYTFKRTMLPWIPVIRTHDLRRSHGKSRNVAVYIWKW